MLKTHIILFALVMAGCTGSSTTNGEGDAAEETRQTVAVDTTLFFQEGITAFTEESCILAGGTTSTCYRFSVTPVPEEHNPGPWCPQTIADDASQGGIWPEGGEIYDVDGPFIANLSSFYNDDTWQLYQSDGRVNITDTAEACAAAARPDVDPRYQNHCVQCETSYLEPGMVNTFIIPKKPVMLDASRPISNPIGVAFNGVNFDPPAPTDAILGAYTLAPFDDCGGHVNLHAGYHYHAATGCSKEIAQDDGHAPMIGYALDGFALFARLNANGEASADLDACRGHSDDARGYHYHVSDPGDNMIIGCFMGESGCAFQGEAEGVTCDATASARPPGPGGGGGRFRTPHEHH